MPPDTSKDLQSALAARYADPPQVDDAPDLPLLHGMAARGSIRSFTSEPVSAALVDRLCAIALASPTKSDLQQRDIVLLEKPESRARLAELIAGQPWIAGAPLIAVFCGNNRRQRLLHDWRNVPFANDHLDAFFNAAVDAGVALSAFVTAAEAAGLGCCPISAVRNRAQEVSALLGLPDHVFPVAGLALGHPADVPEISPRLPLAVTVHRERFDETGVRQRIEAYDQARQEVQPYATERHRAIFGDAAAYGWIEDKVRQYSQPERAGFGAYVRQRGFRLD